MKGWKTIVYGILIAISSIASGADMQQFVADHLPAVGGLMGTAVIILRVLTTSAIFTKE